mgnify:FL=1
MYVYIWQLVRFIIAGESWQDKVDRLRIEFTKMNIDALVITALDEVAWLLNIRGLDVSNEPVRY